MSAMREESEIQKYLELEEKKRAVDEKMISNEKLRNQAIAYGKDTNEEYYTAA